MEEESAEFLYHAVENLDVDKPSEDDIVRAVGRWGRWQTQICIILYLTGFFGFPHVMVFQFFVPEADHWCARPEGFSNWTEEQWKAYSLPPSDEDPIKLSGCHMYDLDYTHVPDDPAGGNRSDTEKVACRYGWEYDRSQFPVTIENEWNLVCDKEFWAKTAASTYNAGLLVGIGISGQLSDIFGRRIVTIVFWAISAVAGLLTCFAPSLQIFCLTRAFVAAGLIGSGTSSYVMMMELLDNRDRAFVSVILSTNGAVGYLAMTLVAYYVPHWRWLNFCISLPLLLMIPLVCLLPESMKWLISQKRYKEAYKIMQKGAKRNHIVFPSYQEFSFIEEEDVTASRKHTVIDLFRFWNLRTKTLNLYFNWFVNSFVYYGISLGVNSLGGSVYLNSFLSAGVELPSSLLSLWTLAKFGRKWNLFGYLSIGGLACMATSLFHKGAYAYNWPIVALAMLGKFCVHTSFGTVYIFSSETFPTVARNVGVGSSSVVARIGSIIAPYVDLLRHLHTAIPLVSYGIMAVLAGCTILLMPETKGRPIPETIEEADKIGRKAAQSPINRRFTNASFISGLWKKKSLV